MPTPDLETTSAAGDLADEDEDEDDLITVFLDAADEFPFHDCVVTPEEPSLSTPATEVSDPDASWEVAASSVLRRRRLVGKTALVSAGDRGFVPDKRIVELYPRLEEGNGGIDRKGSSFEGDGELVSRERNFRFDPNSKEVDSGGIERKGAGFKGDNELRNSVVESVVTEEVSSRAVEGSFKSYDEREVADLDVDDLLESSSEFGGGGTTNDDSWLVYAAGLIIKAIGIQLYFLVKVLKFPFEVFCVSCLFFVDPFGTLRRVRSSLVRKLLRVWNGMWALVSPYLGDWFGENKSLVQILMRYGWGLFTAGYVCVVLFSFMVFAIIGSD